LPKPEPPPRDIVKKPPEPPRKGKILRFPDKREGNKDTDRGKQ
jgi:hypothetical protein